MVEIRRRKTGRLAVFNERERVATLIRDTRAPVVEVGAGACACLTQILADQGFRILALDRDAGAAAAAQRVLTKGGLLARTTLIQADAATPPLRCRSIRTVVAYNALHHTKDLWETVEAMACVLHPRGRLILSDCDEPANGFLGRLTRALRTYFHRVVVSPRTGRRLYVCERPRGGGRRGRRWLHRTESTRHCGK